MPADAVPPDAPALTRGQHLANLYRTHAERLKPKQFRAPSLDALNFLVADVRGALGPYVTVFLAADQNWSLTDVGTVTTLGGYLGLLAQTPLGWLLDHTARKRGLLMLALAVLGVGAAMIAVFPAFWPVLAANACMQVVSGVFEPAIAALTVGLFAREALTRRMGRNAAFARAGNMVVAAASAGLAWAFSPRAVFLQVPIIGLLAIVAAYSIPHGSIDLRRARGLKSGEKEEGGPAHWKALLRSRPLLVFGFAGLLYELADAPLLTIVGQELGARYKGWGLILTSALIVASQAGMLAASVVVGRKADDWGHRLLLIVAFALLPAQAVLTWLWAKPAWLIGLQVFGGIGTGLFAALTPLLLADVVHGTGRYNLSQGAMATLRAIGVTTSGFASEFMVARLGYRGVFLGCAVVGGAALLLLWWAMPETSQIPRPNQRGGDNPGQRGVGPAPRPRPDRDAREDDSPLAAVPLGAG
ncbi:MAG: MFS transporter [Alphaproteobacteria bacterium]|nr:MFS transporter [Alphaproteobacteria bacterium]